MVIARSPIRQRSHHADRRRSELRAGAVQYVEHQVVARPPTASSAWTFPACDAVSSTPTATPRLSNASRSRRPRPGTPARTPAQASANVQAALAGESIINEGAAKLDLPGASTDYKKLFALYQGLGTLLDLASKASGGVSPQDQAQLSKAFNSGLAQVYELHQQHQLQQLALDRRHGDHHRHGEACDREAGDDLHNAASGELADRRCARFRWQRAVQHRRHAEPRHYERADRSVEHGRADPQPRKRCQLHQSAAGGGGRADPGRQINRNAGPARPSLQVERPLPCRRRPTSLVCK